MRKQTYIEIGSYTYDHQVARWCNFNRKNPIISNCYCQRCQQYLLFSCLHKQHLSFQTTAIKKYKKFQEKEVDSLTFWQQWLCPMQKLGFSLVLWTWELRETVRCKYYNQTIFNNIISQKCLLCWTMREKEKVYFWTF